MDLYRDQVFATLFLLSVALGLLLFYGSEFGPENEVREVEELDIGENRVSLGTGCFRLDMFISPEQVERLEMELTGQENERPQAYEIVGGLADSQRSQIRMVEIHSLKDGSYRADLVVNSISGESRIDLRPSDGILIASDQEVPIFVNEDLILEEGTNICLSGSVEL